jgi:tetratricopeptide (TPR) repeat protein
MHPSECFRLLGLPRTANFEEIKLAYRRLARKYHPDVNQADLGAAEKFRLVQEAYQILKDLPKDAKGVVVSPLDRSAQNRSNQNRSDQNRTNRSTQSQSEQAAQRVRVRVEVKSEPPRSEPQRSPKRTEKTAEQTTAKKTELSADPELKLKLDTINRVQDLLRQRKYLVAIPIVEAMRSRFPQAAEVIHWQAVVYQRQGCELLIAGRLREAEIYLNKAIAADPKNRELCFEVKRDLERLQLLNQKLRT